MGEWFQITKLSLIQSHAPASLVKHLPNPIPHRSPGSCWPMPVGLAASLEHSLFLPLPDTAYFWLDYAATYHNYWSNDKKGRWRQILRWSLLLCMTEASECTNRKGKATSAGSEIWEYLGIQIFQGHQPHALHVPKAHTFPLGPSPKPWLRFTLLHSSPTKMTKLWGYLQGSLPFCCRWQPFSTPLRIS